MSNWESISKVFILILHILLVLDGLIDYIKLLKKKGNNTISHSQIKKWIQKQESYSRNKGVKRNFQRGRVIVAGIDDQFDAD